MEKSCQKIEYVGKNIKTVLSVNTLYSVHYFKYCKKFDFQGEKHDFWELVYIDAGVAGVFARVALVVGLEGGRLHVVAATPRHQLLFAMLNKPPVIFQILSVDTSLQTED